MHCPHQLEARRRSISHNREPEISDLEPAQQKVNLARQHVGKVG
jgi:hypothetical protein